MVWREEALSADALCELHLRTWRAKANLRRSYGVYHARILERCPRDARVLEIGTGLGHLADAARARGIARFVATDIFRAPGAHLRCDALRLPFGEGTFDRVVFIDLVHHLAAPHAFFREAARVLRPGGEVLGVEPWITPLSFPIYRFLHQEGCDLGRDPRHPFPAGGAKKPYDGDNAVALLVCRKTRAEEWRALGLEPPRVEPFNDLAYLSTRGFRDGADAPDAVWRAAHAVDRAFSALAGVTGMRAFIVWRKPTA